jgi:hypothetical protein
VQNPTGLEEELTTYESHRAELLGAARSKYVLIKGTRIVDTFESVQDALKRGYDEFGNEPFLVKQVLDVDLPANFTSFQLGA